MSKGRLIRRLLIGGFLLAVAVQIGVFLALREKKHRAAERVEAEVMASTSFGSADAGGPLSNQLVLDGAVVAAILTDASPSTPVSDSARVGGSSFVVAAIESPRERRQRERREAREAAKAERRRLELLERTGRKEEDRLAAQRPDAEAAPTTTSSTTGTVTFRVSPQGASLNLDARFIGKAPLAAVEIESGKHVLAASAPGYAPNTQTFSVKGRQKQTINITLTKAAVETNTEPTIAKRPSTPRVSGEGGNVNRGKGLLGSKCNACHQARGTRSVYPGSKRRSSWARFFAGGYHDRYERIGGLVTRSALADVKAYMMENAKCEGSNVAGTKCKD